MQNAKSPNISLLFFLRFSSAPQKKIFSFSIFYLLRKKNFFLQILSSQLFVDGRPGMGLRCMVIIGRRQCKKLRTPSVLIRDLHCLFGLVWSCFLKGLVWWVTESCYIQTTITIFLFARPPSDPWIHVGHMDDDDDSFFVDNS